MVLGIYDKSWQMNVNLVHVTEPPLHENEIVLCVAAHHTRSVYMAPEIGLARSTSLISVWRIKVIEAKIHFDSVHGI